jgi:hypothetical protein
VFFGLCVCVDFIERRVASDGIAGAAVNVASLFVGAIFWILFVVVMPASILLTLIGVGQSPRSGFSWLALLLALSPLLLFFTAAYFHHLSQQWWGFAQIIPPAHLIPGRA